MLLLAGYVQGPLFCAVSERDALETPKIAAAAAERSTCKLSSANPNSWAAARTKRRLLPSPARVQRAFSTKYIYVLPGWNRFPHIHTLCLTTGFLPIISFYQQLLPCSYLRLKASCGAQLLQMSPSGFWRYFAHLLTSGLQRNYPNYKQATWCFSLCPFHLILNITSVSG